MILFFLYDVNTPLDCHQLMQQINLDECQLSNRNIKLLKDIIWRHKSAFYEYDKKVGLYNGSEKLCITLKSNILSPRIRPNRMSKEKEEEIGKQIADMLQSGMIENSRSPYLSRVVLIRKKDNKWRFVVDFRNINKLLNEQSHHIPRIDRIVEEAAGKLFFTNFDLKNGFHQIPLDNDSKRIAAFATHLGIFQYCVMPMGLAGSPDTFQRIMKDIYSRIPNVHIYLDDLLTCSNNENEQFASIDSILKLNTKYNLKFSLNKCKFAQSHDMYLGFILDKNGIRPNPEKVKAILDKAPPRNDKELKSFLGAVSYFRKHIENFSKSASPPYDIAAILAPPDHTQPYTIYTDASFQGLGACLVQNNRPIAFATRSLSKAKRNYPIIKLEALGLVYALEQFRPYIYGKRTVVITDHKPLLALLQNKKLNNILQRYQMSIMEYDLEIKYIKGEENHIADYLSRDTFNNLEEVFPEFFSWLQQPYYIDKFEKYMSTDEKSELYRKSPPGNRRYVPMALRNKLLRRYHIYSLLGKHYGYDKRRRSF